MRTCACNVVIVCLMGGLSGCVASGTSQSNGGSSAGTAGTAGTTAPGGTGGGNAAMGGTTSGGTSSTTGGNATGGNATGGSSAGGSATGGTAAGGTSTGGTSAGGSSGGGGTGNTGTGGKPGNPGTPGVWQDISPSGVNYTTGSNNFGFLAMGGAKPDQPLTLYVGTCDQGVWKTTNGGDNWFKASTGLGTIDGRNWSLAVDPTNSDVVYTLCGFGGPQGIWKSVNGGVDWTNVQHNITQNDLSHVEIDELNHQHVLVTEHSGNYNAWETTDGGATWSNRGHPWGSANTFLYFLEQDNAGKPSSTFWLGFAENNGLWRTENSGATWTQVSTTLSRSHAGAGLYRAADGALYGSVNATVGRSTDNGRTWIDLAKAGNLPTSPDAYAGVLGDGANVWTMLSNTGAAAAGPYAWVTTSESGDGLRWTQFGNKSYADGPGPQGLVFDPVHRVMYASQWRTGIWRLKYQ